MEEFVFYIGIVLVVLLGPWIFLWRINAARKRDRAENHSRWRDFDSRVEVLERELRKVRNAAIESAIPSAKASASVAPSATDVRPTPDPPPQVAEPPKAPPPQPVFVARTQEPPAPPKPVEKPAALPPPVIPTRPLEPASAPIFRTIESDSTRFDRGKSAADIEETLGTDWLNKLGIAILVLGVAFFLAYQLRTLGPAGKVLVGFVTSGVMLAAGIWFERGERYRILARAGIGGGWALLFFTTYAMYHVPAAQILQSQATDLVLMLAVASCMVLHTLRYQSQVVTGMAFLLAFLTVTISHSNVYSLSAGGVLAAGLVVIVGRMQWFELEIFGMLASYLNHYLWLRPIIEPMHGHRHPFPEFAASAGILSLYWVIFRISYVWRSPSTEEQEKISSAAALLNTALLLALFKYQSAHPEWAFWALLAIGAIETAAGQLPVTRRRRNAVIVLSTIGVVLLIAAFPFRYSGMRLTVLWLVETEALLLIGVWTKEIVFRRLGVIASVLVAGQMLAYDAAIVLGRRMDDADLRPQFALAVMFLVAGAVFYANSEWILRRWRDLFSHPFDATTMQRFSYAGMLMLLAAAWLAFPESWTAVAWSGLGLALIIAGRKLGAADLLYQANFLAMAALVRVFAINLESTDKFHGLTIRLMTISLVTALLYVTSHWSEEGGTEALSKFALPRAAYTWTASALAAILIWYELRSLGVADAWIVFGLLLFELGIAYRRLDLRLQAYVAFISGFLRIFFVNLNAAGVAGEISPRFYSVVPIGLAFFYVYWRLNQSKDILAESERKWRPPEVCCWMGTITFASLMRFELEADWVAVGWAAMAFALLSVSWRSGKRVFLQQALLIVFGVLFRTVLHNFYERSYFPAGLWQSRWITVGVTVGLLLAALPIAFQIRTKDEIDDVGFPRLLGEMGQHPEQVFFFVAVGLLTMLLAIEMRHGMVTLSWGVEGVAVFLLALRLGERSFRLSGLGLLLLCVAKILLQDVWRLNPRDRYLTFIVLGASLLLVSFLYTRNREALRQYL